jgi:hypothetical protein
LRNGLTENDVCNLAEQNKNQRERCCLQIDVRAENFGPGLYPFD